MLSSLLTKTFTKPQAMARVFSSKIKTNRKFGEDAPPKDRGLIHGSIYEKKGYFAKGDLQYSQM